MKKNPKEQEPSLWDEEVEKPKEKPRTVAGLSRQP